MKRVLVVMLAAGAFVGCRQNQPQVPAVRPIPVPPRPVAVTTAPVSPTTAPTTAPTPVVDVKPTIPLPPPPPPVKVAPIATVDGVDISRDEVVHAVMEAHGLNMLLRVVQVEMAKSMAAKEGMVVTADDVKKERETTLFRMAKDANQKLLDDIADAEQRKDKARAERLHTQFDKDAETILQQTLARENMTMAEFDLLMEANAYLRKLAEKDLAGKITDAMVHERYLNTYGENVRVRHIQLANMSEVAAAQAKLKEGVPFEQVALEMSQNASTRKLGGAVPPFSREAQGLSESFKATAFTLKKPGEISEDVAEANGSYHIIQLVERIPPKAVKYDDVKDAVRKDLEDRGVTMIMADIRNGLGRKALDTLVIQDPVLNKQFEDRKARRDTEIKDREQINRELERQRDAQIAASTRPTTAPARVSLRPPATKSGSDTPDPISPSPTTKP